MKVLALWGSDLGLIPSFVVSDSPRELNKQQNLLLCKVCVEPMYQFMRRVAPSAFAQLEKQSFSSDGSLCKPLP